MGLDMYIYDSMDEQVAYWRKFNALHSWMVKNVQGGVDECQRSELSIDHIESLVNILKIIKEVPQKAEVLMPPSDGFFFGSTRIDEYFMEDVANALEVFENIILNYHDEQKFYYQSSW